jgi:regulatory protein
VQDNYNKALNYSFLLLKYRQRSKFEIIERLKSKNYTDSVTKKVISFLEEHDFIDDAAFAPLFINSCIQKSWGPKRIRYALKRLGVSEKLIEKSLPSSEVSKEVLKELARKKVAYYEGKKNSYPKTVNALLRKGYNYGDIFQILNELGVKRF